MEIGSFIWGSKNMHFYTVHYISTNCLGLFTSLPTFAGCPSGFNWQDAAYRPSDIVASPDILRLF